MGFLGGMWKNKLMQSAFGGDEAKSGGYPKNLGLFQQPMSGMPEGQQMPWMRQQSNQQQQFSPYQFGLQNYMNNMRF